MVRVARPAAPAVMRGPLRAATSCCSGPTKGTDPRPEQPEQIHGRGPKRHATEPPQKGPESARRGQDAASSSTKREQQQPWDWPPEKDAVQQPTSITTHNPTKSGQRQVHSSLPRFAQVASPYERIRNSVRSTALACGPQDINAREPTYRTNARQSSHAVVGGVLPHTPAHPQKHAEQHGGTRPLPAVRHQAHTPLPHVLQQEVVVGAGAAPSPGAPSPHPTPPRPDVRRALADRQWRHRPSMDTTLGRWSTRVLLQALDRWHAQWPPFPWPPSQSSSALLPSQPPAARCSCCHHRWLDAAGATLAAALSSSSHRACGAAHQSLQRPLHPHPALPCPGLPRPDAAVRR